MLRSVPRGPAYLARIFGARRNVIPPRLRLDDSLLLPWWSSVAGLRCEVPGAAAAAPVDTGGLLLIGSCALPTDGT